MDLETAKHQGAGARYDHREAASQSIPAKAQGAGRPARQLPRPSSNDIAKIVKALRDRRHYLPTSEAIEYAIQHDPEAAGLAVQLLAFQNWYPPERRMANAVSAVLCSALARSVCRQRSYIVAPSPPDLPVEVVTPCRSEKLTLEPPETLPAESVPNEPFI